MLFVYGPQEDDDLRKLGIDHINPNHFDAAHFKCADADQERRFMAFVETDEGRQFLLIAAKVGIRLQKLRERMKRRRELDQGHLLIIHPAPPAISARRRRAR